MLKPHEIKLDNETVETICIEINVNNSKLKLMVVYRPPTQGRDKDNILFHQMQSLFISSELIIMGDFNLPVTAFEDCSRIPYGSEFHRNLKSSGLEQVVKFPTTEENYLDLIFTTNHNIVSSIKEFISYSDHKSICFDILMRVNTGEQLISVPNLAKQIFVP